MSLYANSPTTRPSAAIQHTLTRHRDILKGKGHGGLGHRYGFQFEGFHEKKNPNSSLFFKIIEMNIERQKIIFRQPGQGKIY